jgi:hypothetical protein
MFKVKVLIGFIFLTKILFFLIRILHDKNRLKNILIYLITTVRTWRLAIGYWPLAIGDLINENACLNFAGAYLINEYTCLNFTDGYLNLAYGYLNFVDGFWLLAISY